MNRDVVCLGCGSPSLIDPTLKQWKCRWCGHENTVTNMPMDAEWYVDFVAGIDQRIAAIEAQNARLLALVREVVETLPPQYEPGELTPYCPWCGNNMWKDHEATCIYTRARALLADLEGGKDTASESPENGL